jgi:cytosine/uracil/thiamine/allantoin permease
MHLEEHTWPFEWCIERSNMADPQYSADAGTICGMTIIIVSRPVVCLFPCIVAWCGLTWHIGFTVQNRFKWGVA